MKKSSVMLLTVPFFLFGFTQSEESLHQVDREKLVEEVKEVSYKAKLPTQLPFKVKEVEDKSVDIQPNTIETFVTGENGEQIRLHIVKGDVEYSYADELKQEKVEIGNKQGNYITSGSEFVLLEWEDDGIHYELKDFSIDADNKISKADLIATAKSFQ